MKAEQYIEERLGNQIDWYNNKRLTNKKYLTIFRNLEIIFAASIPFLSGIFNIELLTHVTQKLNI